MIVLLEEYIPGKEIQVAVMGKKALGAIELVPKREFYDYAAKYSTKAKTRTYYASSHYQLKSIKKFLDLAKKPTKY